jgi:predicted small secreted protein
MRSLICLSFACLFFLSACQTVDGIKRDTQILWDRLQPADTGKQDAQPDSLVPPIAADCPSITIMPELKHLAEFSDPEKPGELNKISEITMVGVQSACKQHKEALSMQVEIVLSGKIGAKGRANKSDKPHFSYPYFIAVTDTTGAVLSKEVFAANVSYAPDQVDSKQIESITQTLPVTTKDDLSKYRVVIGFQLDEDQLAYNRSNQPQKAE